MTSLYRSFKDCISHFLHLWALLLDFKGVWAARVRVHCTAIKVSNQPVRGCTATPFKGV